MGASLATKTLARQLVSDKIGYLVAVLLGAGAFAGAGWLGVGALVGFYALGVVRAYRRWRAS